jgi:hypothetical protein
MDRIITRTHANLLHCHVTSEVSKLMKSKPEIWDSHSSDYVQYHFLRCEVNSLINKIQFYTNSTFPALFTYLFLIPWWVGGNLKAFKTTNILPQTNFQHIIHSTVHSLTKGTSYPLLFCWKILFILTENWRFKLTTLNTLLIGNVPSS